MWEHLLNLFLIKIKIIIAVIIALIFLKIMMLIRQVHLKNLLFVTISILKAKCLGFNQLPVAAAMY